MMPFTWKLNDLGESELTYADEAGSVDSGLADKTVVWTYGRGINVFISSLGTTYYRPTATISGRPSVPDFFHPRFRFGDMGSFLEQ